MQHTLLLALLMPLYYTSDLPTLDDAHDDCCEADCFEPRGCNLKLGDALLSGENSRRYRAETAKCIWDKTRCEDTKEQVLPCIVRYSSTAQKCKQTEIDIYIKGVCCFLRANGCTPTQEVCELIRLMFAFFKGDVRRTTILLAHCIHNTSGFKYLTGADESAQVGAYISRGILQIRGKENYRLADQNGFFLRCPSRMAALDSMANEGALNVYAAVVKVDDQLTFIDSWVALNPLEVQGTNYQLPYFQKIIIGRLNVYLALCQTLGLPVYLGSTARLFLSFCEAYLRDACNRANSVIAFKTGASRHAHPYRNDCAPRYTPNAYSGTIIGCGTFECGTGYPRGRSASGCGRTPVSVY
ncbi:hypothetical protein THOM_1547 [Trachipleistophora hominis]|uniref:Uncharacterized protein n=1 Tax=Trachipleistophora hominis TaxID=72359 RepID=L7JWR5_TRAHO|nr:hypothetical protein THOM_1547 [Trachipleistophora hominis]